MTSVQCVNCHNFNLSAAGRMAYQGCGVCVHDMPHTSYSAKAERECTRFEQAAQEAIDKRIAWLRGRNGN